MSKNTLNITINGSSHTAYAIGTKKTVSFERRSGESIEDAIISTVRNNFTDSSIRPGVLVEPICKDKRYYILKTDCNFYFVRIGNSSISIFSNGPFGFHLEHGHIYCAHVIDDVIIFWMNDKYTKKRVSHYMYVS